MNKVILALGSRTFWVIVLTIVINTINANTAFIPAGAMDIINPLLGLLATYLHVSPSQYYPIQK